MIHCRWWQIFTSTLAAFFGVQTEQNRVRDFQVKSPLPFIIMAVVLALLFVLALLLFVSQVLA